MSTERGGWASGGGVGPEGKIASDGRGVSCQGVLFHVVCEKACALACEVQWGGGFQLSGDSNADDGVLMNSAIVVDHKCIFTVRFLTPETGREEDQLSPFLCLP